MVTREEVACLVLEWLQRENFHETAALFAQEASGLLDRLILPKVRIST